MSKFLNFIHTGNSPSGLTASIKFLWLDYETRSYVNLKNRGLDIYANDPSTEVLMLAWAFDDDEPRLWLPIMGEPMPPELHAGLIDQNVMKCAWNYNFERDITRTKIGIDIPLAQWYDPSVSCAELSLPVGLDRAADALDIDVTLAKHHLTGTSNPKKTFCEPSKALKKMLKAGSPPFYYKDWTTHPEKWQVFCDYCLQDVRAERAAHNAIQKFKNPMPPIEIAAWNLDQEMNDTGVYIDQVFVANAKKYALDEITEILAEIKQITGAENPNSRDQRLEWLQARKYKYTSLDKEHLDEAIKYMVQWGMPEEAQKVLSLIKKLGGSAYTKLQAIEDRIGSDGRLRDQFVYHGAHTGRWSGRGVQLQNLFKPTKEVSALYAEIVTSIRENTLNPAKIVADYNTTHLDKPLKTITLMNAIAGTIRAAFAATPGMKFQVGDLAQIESRVLAALAGCQTMVDLYAGGHDLYIEFMAGFLDKPAKEVTKDERARGKIVILGSGFGMGWEKFKEYAETFGVILTDKEAKDLIYAFRDKYPEIVSYWKELQNAVIKAVKAHCAIFVRGVVVDGRDENMLKIKLPSGRYLHYLNPKIAVEDVFGNGKMQEGVVFESWDAKGRQIKRLYGGLICENIVQAVARDLLLNGMLEARKRGIRIVMTIHDEIVGEVPMGEGLAKDPHDLIAAMTTTPGWAEGMGFVLAAEGYESTYYKK